MPTDGGVRGGRGAEEDILFRRCTYRTKRRFTSSFLGMETFRRKRLFDGVYDYVVKSFQSTRDDEAVARGRDLTIDEHSLIVFNLCRIFGYEILAAIRWFGTNPFRRHHG